MQMLALVWGILAMVGMVVGIVPCLGALNWLNIPFAALGVVIGFIALQRPPLDKKKMAITGTILSSIAAIVGMYRLALGGGIL
jgi:hypothetical protein